MTSKQERKLRMYHAVQYYLIENDDEVKAIPHFKVSFEEFCILIEKIEKTIRNQITPITGIAADKKKRRINLVNEVLTNALKLKMAAVYKNDMRLFNQVNLSKSDIEDKRDLDLKTFSEIIYTEVETHIETFKEYGISKETQKVLREKTDAFFEMIVKPRSAIAERSVTTMQLAELMGKAYQVLLDLDIIMGIIMYEKHDLHSGYKFVRKLVYTRAGRLALRATVKDSVSGKPVRGAVLKFTQDVTTKVVIAAGERTDLAVEIEELMTMNDVRRQEDK